MEYRVISGETMDELEDDVNEYLAAGWQLVGGVSAVAFGDGGGMAWYQAVYHPEKTPARADSEDG